MAKRKQKQIPLPAIKFIGGFILIVFVGVLIYRGIVGGIVNSSHFRVKFIMIDPSLQFIDPNDLSTLKGKSIFSPNLKSVQRNLTSKYPQVSHIRVIRQFPDKICVVAKKRLAFARALIDKRSVTFDDKGLILSTVGEDLSLPLVVSSHLKNQRLVAGLLVNEEYLQTALKIIKRFKENKELAAVAIEEVNIESLSKINVSLANQLQVIIDKEAVDEKIKMLALVLVQGNINPEEVEYIDLRFKEPILGKREIKEKIAIGKKTKK